MRRETTRSQKEAELELVVEYPLKCPVDGSEPRVEL